MTWRVVEQVYVAAIVVAMSNLTPQGADAASTDINKRQAEILCAIYNAASNPPTETFRQKELDKITTEINTINASLAPDAWFNEVEKAPKEPKATEEIRNKYGIDEQGWTRWREAVEKVLEANSPYPRIPVENPAAKLAQVKLRKIESQATAILKKIQSKNDEAKLDKIKEKFNEVIKGDRANEDEVVFSTTDNRVTACGKANGAKGDDVGKNLILDFMCLCAWEVGTHGAGDACFGAQAPVGASANNFAAFDNQPSIIKPMWNTVKVECAKQAHPKTTDTRFLRHAIAEFLRELDEFRSGDDSSRKHGVLGSLENDASAGCDGKYTAGGGPCVMYAKAAGKRDYEVGWRAPLEAGLKLLEDAEAKTAAIQSDITHFTALLTRAQLVYAELKASLEVGSKGPQEYTKKQTQNQSQSHTTSTDKVTAQELTTVSIASIQRFMLSWTLFI